MARAMQLRSALVMFVQERPGRPIPLAEIEKHTGFNARQIQAGMLTLCKDGALPGLVNTTQGQVWRYDPSAGPVLAHDLLLTFLRQLDDASGLYLDDGNGVYKVVKIA